MRPRDSFPKATTAAARALTLEDSLPQAHATLAAIHLVFDWDWAGAGREIQRAFDLNPNLVLIRHWRAHYLFVIGRADDALVEGRLALQLDPLDLPAGAHQGWHAYYAHDFEHARELLKQSTELEKNQYWAWLFLQWTDEQLGHFDEAIEAFEHLGATPPQVMALRRGLMSGADGYWRARLTDALEHSRQEYISPLWIAKIYARLGDTAHALAYLDRAYEERDSNFVYLSHEPAFDRLHREPRFVALQAKLRLP